MIKRYINHQHTKSTHERRQHAAQVAGGAVALLAVMWLASFSVRLPHMGESAGQVAEVVGGSTSQLANVLSGRAANQGNNLEASQTSVLTPQ